MELNSPTNFFARRERELSNKTLSVRKSLNVSGLIAQDNLTSLSKIAEMHNNERLFCWVPNLQRFRDSHNKPAAAETWKIRMSLC